MADYISDIQPLEGDGVTDADILATLQAYFNKEISITALRRYLRDEDLLNNELSYGTLLDAHSNPAIPDVLKKAIRRLAGIVADRRDTIPATSGQDAVDFSAALKGFLSAGLITQGQFDHVVSLGGGWKFADLTTAKIAEIRTAYQSRRMNQVRVNDIDSLITSLINTHVEPAKSDGISTVEDVKAAIKAAL